MVRGAGSRTVPTWLAGRPLHQISRLRGAGEGHRGLLISGIPRDQDARGIEVDVGGQAGVVEPGRCVAAPQVRATPRSIWRAQRPPHARYRGQPVAVRRPDRRRRPGHLGAGGERRPRRPAVAGGLPISKGQSWPFVSRSRQSPCVSTLWWMPRGIAAPTALAYQPARRQAPYAHAS